MIPDVDVRIPAFARRPAYEGWIVEDFEAGCRSFAGWPSGPAAIIRVSVIPKPKSNLAMACLPARPGRYLAGPGRGAGYHRLRGQPAAVHRSRSGGGPRIRRGGGVYLGRGGRGELGRGRFHGPYLRGPLLERGVDGRNARDRPCNGVATEPLRTVRGPEERTGCERDGKASSCAISHAYRDGASLYFTVISTQGRTAGQPTGER